MIEFEATEIPIDQKLVLDRLSSHGRARATPSDRLQLQIQEMLSEARELIHPRAIYRIYNTPELRLGTLERQGMSYHLDHAIQVAFAVCTLGEEISMKVDEYMKDNQLVRGVILDAIGSIAADSLADKVNELINTRAEEQFLVGSPRYSPGYCDLGVEYQKVLFDHLEPDFQKIGVSLSPEFMMYPVKSVSFMVDLGKAFINRCRECEQRQDCPHRR